MTDNIPIHLRITGLSPSNDDVDACRSAAADLAGAWSKVTDVNRIAATAAAIAESLGGDGMPNVAFGTEIQTAMQEYASAFVYPERPLEVGVCAGMAFISMVRSDPGTQGWQILDVYTNALWSALTFQPVLDDAKRENLRREVLARAQQRSVDSAEMARTREAVAAPTDLTITTADDGKVTTNYKKAALGTIEALRRNAVLDREEIDFLWWSQLARSKLLNRPLARISEAVRLVASGIEGSNHLRRLPAEVHRDLALRTADEDPELDLATLLTEIGDDRSALAAGIQSGHVTGNPTIFPLLNAVLTGSADCVGAGEKRKASAWGGRALLEGGLSRMMSTGMPSK